MGETSLFASGRRDGVNGEVRAAGGGRGPSPRGQALLELLVTPSMGQPLRSREESCVQKGREQKRPE